MSEREQDEYSVFQRHLDKEAVKGMDYKKLLDNLIDMLMEQQAKLGYLSETVRLYYPLNSLNHLLSKDLNSEEMMTVLQKMTEKCQNRFGQIKVTYKENRFCFVLPPQMSDYVHVLSKNRQEKRFRFILDLVKTLSDHTCTIEKVRELFLSYSDRVHEEETDIDEFDFLFFFEDGEPDEYCYLIKDEGHHLTYHRFSHDDFEELFVKR